MLLWLPAGSPWLIIPSHTAVTDSLSHFQHPILNCPKSMANPGASSIRCMHMDYLSPIWFYHLTTKNLFLFIICHHLDAKWWLDNFVFKFWALDFPMATMITKDVSPNVSIFFFEMWNVKSVLVRFQILKNFFSKNPNLISLLKSILKFFWHF